MADRTSRIILEVTDKFSAPLKQFQQGMQQTTQATGAASQQMNVMAADNDRAAASLSKAASSTREFGDKQTTLHSILGSSRQETRLFEQAVVQFAGAEGIAGQAAAALASGISGIGLAIVAASVALNYYQQWLEDTGKKEAEFAAHAVLGADKFFDADKKAGLAEYDRQIQEVSKHLAQLKAMAAAPELYNMSAAQLAKDIEATNKQLYDLIGAQNALAQSSPYDDLTRQMDSFGDSAFRGTQNTKDFAAAMDLLNRSANIGGKSHSPREFGSDNFEGMNPYGGSNAGRSSAIDAEAREIGRKADEAQRKAEAAFQRSQSLIESMQSSALSIFDQMQRGGANSANEVAKSFSDAFTRIVAEQAKMNGATNVSLIQLQKEYDTVFAAMSKSEREMLLSVMDAGGEAASNLIAQLAAIAAAGGSVEDQLNAIRAAFARLNGMTSNMYLNIFTNIRGGGTGSGGHQQGNEWDFTLEGESYAVRAAYMEKYGDYGRANAAWQADHAAELAKQGRTPGDTAPGTYAFGDHGVTTGPRLMLVGERGPERVDITPGTGGGGQSDGQSISVTINSLTLPNEFEIQQLASKLKRYMRN